MCVCVCVCVCFGGREGTRLRLFVQDFFFFSPLRILFLIRVRGLGFCGEGERVTSDGQARSSQEDRSGAPRAGAGAWSLFIWHCFWQGGWCQWAPGSLGCSPVYGSSGDPGQGLGPLFSGQDNCHFTQPLPLPHWPRDKASRAAQVSRVFYNGKETLLFFVWGRLGFSASRLTRWECRERVCTEGGLLLQIPSPCPLHPAWFPSVTLCRLPGFWPLRLGRAKASGRGLGEFSSLILSPSCEEREKGPSPEGIDQKTSGPLWPT